jgi:DNA-binding transcriptional MerR regulator
LEASFLHALTSLEQTLPPIPAKRYFTIGEVSELCGVKPHVLRYWEQEFTQLRPMKRRGNRRYYQHHEVLMIRRIRDLLYDQGFTISGARNKLLEFSQAEQDKGRNGEYLRESGASLAAHLDEPADLEVPEPETAGLVCTEQQQLQQLRRELHEIRNLLTLTL